MSNWNASHRQEMACEIAGFWHVGPTDGPAVAYVMGSSDEARLIAAAPDLYEALRAARDAVEGHFDDNCDVCREAIDMINGALAKADGRS